MRGAGNRQIRRCSLQTGKEKAGGGRRLMGKRLGERERAGLDFWISRLNGRGYVCSGGQGSHTSESKGSPSPAPSHLSPQVLEAWEKPRGTVERDLSESRRLRDPGFISGGELPTGHAVQLCVPGHILPGQTDRPSVAPGGVGGRGRGASGDRPLSTSCLVLRSLEIESPRP